MSYFAVNISTLSPVAEKGAHKIRFASLLKIAILGMPFCQKGQIKCCAMTKGTLCWKNKI